jgi:hypothetical protein
MDFVSDLEEIEELTERERIERENRSEPVGIFEKADRVLFEGGF